MTKGCWSDSQQWLADVQCSSCFLDWRRLWYIYSFHYSCQSANEQGREHETASKTGASCLNLPLVKKIRHAVFFAFANTKSCIIRQARSVEIIDGEDGCWSCSGVAKLILSQCLWTMSFQSYPGENKVSAMRAQRIHIYNLRLSVHLTLQHPWRHAGIHFYSCFNTIYTKASTISPSHWESKAVSDMHCTPKIPDIVGRTACENSKSQI